MTCPHLEETSALFDGRPVDRAHAGACPECRAFLADAAHLRESMRTLTFPEAPRRRLAPILVPAALVLGIVAAFFLRPDPSAETGPLAGLDGGGRAVISVKDVR